MTCSSCEVENLVFALHEVEDCSSHGVQNLVLALHELKVVKFGNFKLNNDLAHVIWVGKVKVERSQKKVAKREKFVFHFYYCILVFFLCCRQATCLFQERCKASQLRERERKKIKTFFCKMPMNFWSFDGFLLIPQHVLI